MLFLTSAAVYPPSWCPPWSLQPPDGAARLLFLLISLLSKGMNCRNAEGIRPQSDPGLESKLWITLLVRFHHRGTGLGIFRQDLLAILQITPANALSLCLVRGKTYSRGKCLPLQPVAAGGHENSVSVTFIFPSWSTYSLPRVNLPQR